MSQRQTAFGRPSGKPPRVTECLTPDELHSLTEHQRAVDQAQQALNDAQLELGHTMLMIRRAHGWDEKPRRVDLATGEATLYSGT